MCCSRKKGFRFSFTFILKTMTYTYVGLNNIYSDKVHDIHKYNVKIVGSDSKPVAYLDHLLDMLYNLHFI